MKKTMIALAVASMCASGSAMAQGMMGPKAGTTKEAAMTAAERAFGRMDGNGDGMLDAEEAGAFLKARAEKANKPVRAKAASKLIRRNDDDGDGKVSLAEFKAKAGERFDKADSNGNGVIDADEAKGGKSNDE